MNEQDAKLVEWLEMEPYHLSYIEGKNDHLPLKQAAAAIRRLSGEVRRLRELFGDVRIYAPADSRAFKTAQKALTETGSSDTLTEAIELLEDHHKHHLTLGEVHVPDGKGGYIGFDSGEAYSESSMFDRTDAFLSKHKALQENTDG